MRRNVSECVPLIIAIPTCVQTQGLHFMSRQSLELAQPPRVLASAIGVALTAFSAPSFAQSASDTASSRRDSPVALDEVTVIGEQEQTYKADASASNKYTAPLRETPKSVTVITDQVIRDTG